MTTASWSDFFRHLSRGMAAETLADHSDRQLVKRALAGRDEAAFQAIVHRHGPMVYRVCWRVLQHSQDTEDAFQATFLVLAQKLRALRKRASLASWLHGVAHRVALKAKAQTTARQRHEHEAARPASLPPDEVTWGELCSTLDCELSRLPDRWRLPLILCYLEGQTQDEAACQLRWSKSTLRRRLEEARSALGRRLSGRGTALPAMLSAVLVSDCMASAQPAPRLVAATVEAAAGVAAGKAVMTAASTQVAALTEGVLHAMFLTKLKLTTAVLFGLCLVVAGAGGLSYTTRATEQTESRPEAQPEDKKAAPEGVQDTRQLLEKARALRDAQALVREKEAILKEAQAILSETQQRYEKEQDRYEAARARGQAKEGTIVTGTLGPVDAEQSSVRVQWWKTGKTNSGEFRALVWEDFSVAKDATIAQDNRKTRLADLKRGSHLTLHLQEKSVVSIVADGGTVPGPIRYVSANEARNTIAVIAGRKDERRVYHLVKETEVTTASGKATRVQDFKEGTLLLLTLSVEDANTVIRIEALLLDKEREE